MPGTSCSYISDGWRRRGVRGGAREQISPLSETTSRNSRYSHERGSGPYCRAETKRPRVRRTRSRKLKETEVVE